MLETFIRIFFLLITAIYTYYKILNQKPTNKLVPLKLFVLSILMCSITAFSFSSNQSLCLITIFLMFLLLMQAIEKQHLTSTYVAVLFSFAFSYISFYVSIMITSIILSIFYYQNYEISWILPRVLIGLIQFFLIYCCFSISRLRKGMTFLYNLPTGNIGFTICITIIMLIIAATKVNSKTHFFLQIFFSSLLLSGFLLLYWWNYHITQTYRKHVKNNEIHTLTLLLEEKNKELEKLKSDNDRLSRAIHKDNKLIPIIYNAIIESNAKKIPLDLSQWEPDSPLGLKLKQLYDERWQILNEPRKEYKDFPQTDFEYINAAISFMYSEAKSAGIPFQIMLFDNLKSTIPEEITEDDFCHLLSDLLSNALHACTGISGAFILLYLGKMENISTIRIHNTGNVFHMETLKNLGLTRHTTHADTGGSGIGLMDIWRLKEKYKATLLIDELTNGSSSEIYTCIDILFNHKNHYIIQSDRHKELSTYINRPDLRIISKD